MSNKLSLKKDNSKEEFENSIKVEIKNDYINDMKREEILNYLEKNPKLFYDLPIEKLEKLENYYKDSIRKLEEKLARINNSE